MATSSDKETRDRIAKRFAEDHERCRLADLDRDDPQPVSRLLLWSVQQETGLENVKATLAHHVRHAEWRMKE